MVISYIYFKELESAMLHSKFQDNTTSGYREEDCQRFLSFMGMAAI